jgi:hypothetical protein
MMTVEVDQIAPTKDGLSFGLIIRYGDGGPVRFAQAYLPYRNIARWDRSLIVDGFNRLLEEVLDPVDEPLPDL